MLYKSLGYVLTTSLFAACISASEYNNNNNTASLNTYQGKEITTDNLYELGEQAPQEVQVAFEEFVQKNPTFIEKVMVQDGPIHEFREKRKAAAEELEKLGMTNLSRNNFIVPLNEGHLIKISGPSSRMLLKGAVNNMPYKAYTAEEVEKQMAIKPLTYQTASEKAHYLRFIEALNTYKCDKVTTAKLYLVSREKQKIEDEYAAIILQRKADFDKLIPLGKVTDTQDLKEIMAYLPQYIKASAYAGIWDAGNIYWDPASRTLFRNDFEQPNTTKPDQFANNSEKRHAHNICTGFGELCRVFPKGSNERKFVVEQIVNANDPIIKSAISKARYAIEEHLQDDEDMLATVKGNNK